MSRGARDTVRRTSCAGHISLGLSTAYSKVAIPIRALASDLASWLQ